MARITDEKFERAAAEKHQVVRRAMKAQTATQIGTDLIRLAVHKDRFDAVARIEKAAQGEDEKQLQCGGCMKVFPVPVLHEVMKSKDLRTPTCPSCGNTWFEEFTGIGTPTNVEADAPPVTREDPPSGGYPVSDEAIPGTGQPERQGQGGGDYQVTGPGYTDDVVATFDDAQSARDEASRLADETGQTYQAVGPGYSQDFGPWQNEPAQSQGLPGAFLPGEAAKRRAQTYGPGKQPYEVRILLNGEPTGNFEIFETEEEARGFAERLLGSPQVPGYGVRVTAPDGSVILDEQAQQTVTALTEGHPDRAHASTERRGQTVEEGRLRDLGYSSMDIESMPTSRIEAILEKGVQKKVSWRIEPGTPAPFNVCPECSSTNVTVTSVYGPGGRLGDPGGGGNSSKCEACGHGWYTPEAENADEYRQGGSKLAQGTCPTCNGPLYGPEGYCPKCPGVGPIDPEPFSGVCGVCGKQASDLQPTHGGVRNEQGEEVDFACGECAARGQQMEWRTITESKSAQRNPVQPEPEMAPAPGGPTPEPAPRPSKSRTKEVWDADGKFSREVEAEDVDDLMRLHLQLNDQGLTKTDGPPEVAMPQEGQAPPQQQMPQQMPQEGQAPMPAPAQPPPVSASMRSIVAQGERTFEDLPPGVQVKWSAVNQAYLVMWNDQVLNVLNTAEEVEYALRDLRPASRRAQNGGSDWTQYMDEQMGVERYPGSTDVVPDERLCESCDGNGCQECGGSGYLKKSSDDDETPEGAPGKDQRIDQGVGTPLPPGSTPGAGSPAGPPSGAVASREFWEHVAQAWVDAPVSDPLKPGGVPWSGPEDPEWGGLYEEDVTDPSTVQRGPEEWEGAPATPRRPGDPEWDELLDVTDVQGPGERTTPERTPEPTAPEVQRGPGEEWEDAPVTDLPPEHPGYMGDEPTWDPSSPIRTPHQVTDPSDVGRGLIPEPEMGTESPVPIEEQERYLTQLEQKERYPERPVPGEGEWEKTKPEQGQDGGDWFADMSPEEQAKYTQEHPGTEKGGRRVAYNKCKVDVDGKQFRFDLDSAMSEWDATLSSQGIDPSATGQVTVELLEGPTEMMGQPVTVGSIAEAEAQLREWATVADEPFDPNKPKTQEQLDEEEAYSQAFYGRRAQEAPLSSPVSEENRQDEEELFEETARLWGGTARRTERQALFASLADDWGGRSRRTAQLCEECSSSMGQPPEVQVCESCEQVYCQHVTHKCAASRKTAQPIGMPPAAAGMSFERANERSDGDRVLWDVSWEPDLVEVMSSEDIKQNIRSYVQREASEQQDTGRDRTKNWGTFIGDVNVEDFDVDGGIATISFQTSEQAAPQVAPAEVT